MSRRNHSERMPAALNPQLEMDGARRVCHARTRLQARLHVSSSARPDRAKPAMESVPRHLSGETGGPAGAIQGKEASSFESIRRGSTISSPALAGLDMAMLDLVGKFTKAPVYQVLGGPTRNQARALARIEGETDDAVVAAVTQARAAGHSAFLIPVPATHSPNHSATLVNATRRDWIGFAPPRAKAATLSSRQAAH